MCSRPETQTHHLPLKLYFTVMNLSNEALEEFIGNPQLTIGEKVASLIE